MKHINNTSWSSPLFPNNLMVMLLLVGVTIIIETGCVYVVAKRKGYKGIMGLLIVVVLANALTGLLGLSIGLLM